MQFIQKYYNCICVALIFLSLLLACFFGTKKQGFFIDENYTYTLSNGTQLGIAVENGKWMDTSEFLSQVVSEGDENFRFGRMYENTANDVHPPLYYVLFHFASSLFSGVYSKWIGLGINLLLLLPVLFTVKDLAYHLSGENKPVTLITLAFFGLSPATMSNTMLIRMYLLMALWTLIYAKLHVEDLKREQLSIKKFLVPVFITGFLGFLTQYFFVVVMFFITFAYAFYLMVFCRRIKDSLIYGATVLASLLATVLVWPYSKFHIFGGYRGEGAMNQLLDVSQILSRTATYTGYANDQVFGKLLPLYALLALAGIVLLILYMIRRRKMGEKEILKSLPLEIKGLILLSFGAVMDFLVIAQVGLLSNENSCRHMFNAYALFTVLLPVGVFAAVKALLKVLKREQSRAVFISALLLCITLVTGYLDGQVLFLYETDGNALDFAAAHPEETVVAFYKNNGMYDSRIQDFVQYPEVYTIDAADLSAAEDERIAKASELLVYMSTQIKNADECFDAIYAQNPSLTEAEHLWDCGNYYAVYLMK